MLHEPAAQSGPDPASDYKQRLGIIMFFIYAIIYGGFIAINVVNAELMELPIVLGLNLAMVYGFILIVTALVMALVYNHLCTKRERALKTSKEQS